MSDSPNTDVRDGKESGCGSPTLLRARGLPVVLAAVFLLSLAMLPLTSRWRGDERFYTDAVVQMFETGDFLTPYASDGQPRFQKPILIYWAIAVSHKLFGGGFLGVRLPFLLAAAATLAMAWLLALRWFKSRETAWATLGILLGSSQVIKLSARATPDMLQCSFVTLSLLGLAGMLFDRRFTWQNRLMFWAGAGLVAATKGGLGLLLILFAFGFALWRGRRLGVRPSQLLHLPSMALAIAVAGAWFAAVLLQHGETAWSGFWQDQVGSRFEGSKLYLLSNAATYLTAPILDLLPWSAVLLFMAWRDRPVLREVLREHREAAWFVLAWHGLLLLVFTVGNMPRERYLLSAYAPDAALLAALLLGWLARRPAASRAFDVAAGAMTVAVAVAGLRHVPLVLRGVLPDIAGPILVWAVAAPALAFAAWRWMRASPPALRVTLTGCLLMAGSRLDDLLVRRVVYPSPAPVTANLLLDRTGGPPRTVAAIGLSHGNASQLRILMAGRVHVDGLAVKDATPARLAAYDAVILEERARSVLTPAAWTLEPAGEGYRDWSPADFARLAVGAAPAPIVARRRDRLLIGRPLAPPDAMETGGTDRGRTGSNPAR